MLPSFAQQTVTIIRPGVQISRGSEIPDWSNPTTITVNNCSVQPAASGLSQDGRVLGILDGLTGYFQPGTDIREGDRVLYDGLAYTVNGVPRAWQSATGRVSYIQANLRRWDG